MPQMLQKLQQQVQYLSAVLPNALYYQLSLIQISTFSGPELGTRHY